MVAVAFSELFFVGVFRRNIDLAVVEVDCYENVARSPLAVSLLARFSGRQGKYRLAIWPQRRRWS